MGGTTAKAASVEHGRVALTTEYEVGAGINVQSMLVKGGGHALRVPVVDISEIGAGGGSIVRIDRGGRLAVGPESAGAVPGPVAYDLGGTAVTVTDAHIVLGFTNPAALAGGAVALRPDLARDALADQVASPLGISLVDAAHGVHAVACTTMIRAVKAVSTFRGRDPRRATLIVFGGNGAIVGADMARELGIGRVVVPPHAGLFSAFGLLEAEIELQVGRTIVAPATATSVSLLSDVLVTLEEEARGIFVAQGYAAQTLAVRRRADLRYENQGFEFTVDIPGGGIDPSSIVALADAFEAVHEQTYGHRATDEVVEVTALRVAARVVGERTHSTVYSNGRAAAPRATTVSREVYFGREAGMHATPVIERSALTVPTRGPLIVQEYDTSCVVPPGASAVVDEDGNIVIDLGDTGG